MSLRSVYKITIKEPFPDFGDGIYVYYFSSKKRAEIFRESKKKATPKLEIKLERHVLN